MNKNLAILCALVSLSSNANSLDEITLSNSSQNFFPHHAFYIQYPQQKQEDLNQNLCSYLLKKDANFLECLTFDNKENSFSHSYRNNNTIITISLENESLKENEFDSKINLKVSYSF